MTWKQLTERDCREWKLSDINPHDRHTWRSGKRSAMRKASQLSGGGGGGGGGRRRGRGGGALVWMYLHVNKKSDYDMI